MIGQRLSYFTPDQVQFLRGKVMTLLDEHGVKLDPHPQMFEILSKAGAMVDSKTNMVRFPRPLMEEFIKQAPKKFSLGAGARTGSLSFRDPTAPFMPEPAPAGTAG